MRNYSNTALPTTLTGSISGTDVTISVGSTTGFPVAYPYTLVLDADAANEELVEVTAATGTVLTVTRGLDGTAGIPHAANAPVKHAVSARDFRESRLHEAATSGVHGVSGALVGTTDTQQLSNKTFNVFALTSGEAAIDSNGLIHTNNDVNANTVRGNTLALASGNALVEGTGNIRTVADVFCNTVHYLALAQDSSREVKQDITPTAFGLADLLRLEVVDFAYKARPNEPRTGLIAEDTESVFPRAVVQGETLAVDYTALVPVLIRAVQELASEVQRLKGE